MNRFCWAANTETALSTHKRTLRLLNLGSRLFRPPGAFAQGVNLGQARIGSRGQQMSQMAQIFGQQLPAISLLFPPNVWAADAALKGPHEGPPETNVFWNIQEWTLQG